MAKAKRKRTSYIQLPLGISRAELQARLDRKLNKEEWESAVESLEDYIDWDVVDEELDRAIRGWDKESKEEEEED